ncbi:MAG: UDP-2,3-diacylglucosamine diphosphatase [Pirellulales bacterium]
MLIDPGPQERAVRTLFVSDVHIGCRYAQPERFLAYLQQVRPEQIFILGDFLDGWKLQSTWRWKPVYTQIVKRLVQLAQDGAELFYTPGNHDAFLRCADVRYLVESTGVNVQVQDEFVFRAADGRRFLVTHGDKFDVIEMRYQWLSIAASFVYEPMMFFDHWASRLFGREGYSPYSRCVLIKGKVKSAIRFLSHFEQTLFRHARSLGCDGVICGHIHTPGLTTVDEVTYFNTGDWVENCTALVEHYDGSLRLESAYPAGFPAVVSPRVRSVPWEREHPLSAAASKRHVAEPA